MKIKIDSIIFCPEWRSKVPFCILAPNLELHHSVLLLEANPFDSRLTMAEGNHTDNPLLHAKEYVSIDVKENSDTHSKEFPFNFDGISSEEAKQRLLRYGRNELPEKTVPKWYIYVSQLWQPMPVMIWLAVIIEAGIQNWPDMVILLVIQFTNASIGYYETTKAGDAVAALKHALKPLATVKRDGRWMNIDAAEVVPGDTVLLASGSAVPADCRVNEGTIDVDQAQLTGESLPVSMHKADSCRMGSTVVRGEVEGTVEFTGSNTFLGRTAALLSNTGEVSNLQAVIMNMVIILTALSLTLCFIVFMYLLLASETDAVEAISFSVVVLVASIPLAIEIVTTTTLALGSKEMTRDGAIVARLAAIEDMAGMAILCCDKTGTLTLNKMEIQPETPIYKTGETQYSLLRYAAMAARWKEPPRDALDTLTLTAVDMSSLDTVEQLDFMPFDPVVKRTEGTVREKGKVFKTTKGAPQILIKLCKDDKIRDRCESDMKAYGARGIRCLGVAKTTGNNDDWELLGMLTFMDPPRPDTRKTLMDAEEYGVKVKMVTGDHVLIAREVARALGMGDYIKPSDGLPLLDPDTKKKPPNLGRDYGDMCLAVDGFAQVFPEHKYLIVECLRELGYKVGMTGDGVNDAPALKRADVGIAVEGSTDAARAASDIVLTQPGLSTIITGIFVSRKIFSRIRNFINYRIAATLQLLLFFFIAVFIFKPVDYMPSDWQTDPNFPNSQPWPKFFHIPVLMLMLITLLNDGTLIAIGYDNVIPLKTPEKWNIAAMFLVASVLAGVALMSSLLLLQILLNSWKSDGILQGFGMKNLSYGQVTTAMYLKVSVSDFLTLFSSRSGERWFWSSRPANILLAAAAVALTTSTILAISWPASYPDGVYSLGLGLRDPKSLFLWIWAYCLVWWIIQDAAKVGIVFLMKRYNWFGYNNTGKLVMPSSTLRYIDSNKVADMSVLFEGHSH